MPSKVRKKIFFTAPGGREFDPVRTLVRSVASGLGAEYLRLDYSVTGMAAGIQQLPAISSEADLVIADVTDLNPYVMFELGAAHAMGRPILLMAQLTREVYGAGFGGYREITYRMSDIDGASSQMRDLISDALANPDHFKRTSDRDSVPRKKLFISYSRADQEYLERLLVHLRPLEREGLIDLWADTKIAVGAHWKSEIEAALATAAIGVLLTSANLLASDFIVENELPPLLVAAEKNGTRIVPVIVGPSRFQRERSLALFQAINDPKTPLMQMGNSEREALYAKLTEVIEGYLVP